MTGFFLLRLPINLFVNNSALPAGTSINIHRGTLWSGNADVYVGAANPEAKKPTQILLVNWGLCSSGSFPFFAYCLEIKSGGNDHSVKLVGLPGAKIKLHNIKSELDVSFITQQIKQQQLALLNLRGSLSVDMNRLIIDRPGNIPSSWDGRITLNDGGFFNVDLPQLTMVMSQREFISRDETSQAFGNNKLPTIIIQGADDTMSLDGSVQFLPDNQAKLSLEILARDDLVEQTFAPLATNREGRKLFITYQGAIGPPPSANQGQQGQQDQGQNQQGQEVAPDANQPENSQ